MSEVPQAEDYELWGMESFKQDPESKCSKQNGRDEKWIQSFGFPGWSLPNCETFYKSSMMLANCAALKSAGFQRVEMNDSRAIKAYNKGFTISFF